MSRFEFEVIFKFDVEVKDEEELTRVMDGAFRETILHPQTWEAVFPDGIGTLEIIEGE